MNSDTKLFYTNEELPQRSEAWLEWRSTCVGGSDVGKVLGLLDKYEKPHTLWKRKLGMLEPIKQNAAMRRGAEMEDEAARIIRVYLKEYGIDNAKIEPIVAKHPKYDYIGVSFDGVDEDFITEIKCPAHVNSFKSVLSKGIPNYYYAQVQLQLMVANAIWGIDKGYFCSYFPDGLYHTGEGYEEEFHILKIIKIDHDPKYCAAMRKVVEKFWSNIQTETWDDEEYTAVLEEFYADRNN